MTRILVIVPFALDAEGVRNREAQSRYVPLPQEWELTYRPVTCGPSSFMSPHDWGLMDLAIFEAGCNAEAEGFDAVCIDTMSDSGMVYAAIGAFHSRYRRGEGVNAIRADARRQVLCPRAVGASPAAIS